MFGVLKVVFGVLEVEVFGVFEVATTMVEGFGVFQVLLVRIWNILSSRGKYFEYLKYNIEEVFRVNEVSRRPRAVGAFQ